jgi:hypothetical protein
VEREAIIFSLFRRKKSGVRIGYEFAICTIIKMKMLPRKDLYEIQFLHHVKSNIGTVTNNHTDIA